MAQPEPVIYRLNAADCLDSVNDGWIRFAEKHQVMELMPQHLLGRRVWEFLTDPATTGIYLALLKRLRERRARTQFSFRCDSHDSLRLMSMTIVSEPKGTLVFQSETLLEQERRSQEMLQPRRNTSQHQLRVCSWCSRIASPGGMWLDIEDAPALLQLFTQTRVPAITHGICEECFEKMDNVIDSV